MGFYSQNLAQWLVVPVVEWKQDQNSGMIKKLKVCVVVALSLYVLL